MGDRYNRRLQAANSTVEFAGAGSKSRSSSKDSGESVEARYSKLLVQDAQGWIPARHSTSSCTFSDRKDLEDVRKWTSSLQRRDDVVTASFGFVGSSFRSEDSEVLALWEEKSEKSPKAVSTDLSWLKPSVEFQSSPWRETVSNAVKKIESLSHAFSRSSPVHPKGDAVLQDSPRPSLEYLKKSAGGRSSWRDFKTVSNTSPTKSPETVLHNSPKARYSDASLCRVMARDELESLQSLSKLHQFGPSAAAPRPVDFNLRRQVEYDSEGDRSAWRDSYHDKRAQRINESLEDSGNLSSGQPPMQLESLSNQIQLERLFSGKPKSVEAGSKPREFPKRSVPLTLNNLEGAGYGSRQTIAERATLARQATKGSVEAVSSSMERCSSRMRAHSMDEAVLNEYASEPGVQQARAGSLHSQEAGDGKPSHRYYQRVTSRERSSRWSSCDDTPLDHIDFVAPSAARFLEDEGCVSPVKSPIKTPGAVPFKWEKEPGKPKEDSDPATSAQFGSVLQLPPRLASRKQFSSPLRNRYINMSLSAPLAELSALPSQKATSSSSESESTKVQLPWIEISTTSEMTAENSSRSASDSERGPSRMAAIEPPITKSRSVGDMRSAGLQTKLSRLSAGGDAGVQGAVVTSQIISQYCTDNGRQLDHEQKPAQSCLNTGGVRPTSPTSILCGPGDGSLPSSNPSLSSGHEAPQVSATAASALWVPSCASFDSMEHSIEMSSELMSPESSLTSPLRANTRCNSMAYNEDFDQMGNYLSSDSHKGASQSENAFVKFCKTGKRWMKTRTLSKLGTIYSPEVWAPGITMQLHRGAGSDFSARLGGMPTTSKIDHSHVRIESRFAAPTSALEDMGDRSPAYAATLELLSPVERFSSKKTSKNRRTKPPPRSTRKTTSRLRVRARMRARFLVPMRRVLRTLFSRCTFRRRNKKVKAAPGSSKPLYHVDYTLSQAAF